MDRLGVPLNRAWIQEPLLAVGTRVIAHDGVRAAAADTAAATALLVRFILVSAGTIVPLIVVTLTVIAIRRARRRPIAGVPRMFPTSSSAPASSG